MPHSDPRDRSPRQRPLPPVQQTDHQPAHTTPANRRRHQRIPRPARRPPRPRQQRPSSQRLKPPPNRSVTTAGAGKRSATTSNCRARAPLNSGTTSAPTRVWPVAFSVNCDTGRLVSNDRAASDRRVWMRAARARYSRGTRAAESRYPSLITSAPSRARYSSGSGAPTCGRGCSKRDSLALLFGQVFRLLPDRHARRWRSRSSRFYRAAPALRRVWRDEGWRRAGPESGAAAKWTRRRLPGLLKLLQIALATPVALASAGLVRVGRRKTGLIDTQRGAPTFTYGRDAPRVAPRFSDLPRFTRLRPRGDSVVLAGREIGFG